MAPKSSARLAQLAELVEGGLLELAEYEALRKSFFGDS